MRYAASLAGKMGYLELRKYARNNVRTGIKMIDEKITNWGLQEGQTFQIAQKLENKLDKVEEENKPLGSFLKTFVDGFGENLSEFILLI